jgi:hypothetical protein
MFSPSTSNGATLMCVRSVAPDRDVLIIEEMLAPPPLEDARSSLEYWQRRRKALPLYRRSARREAKEMTARWQERVRAAELARFEASVAGRVLARLGISSIWFQRIQTASELLSWVAWVVVLRKVKLVVGSFVAIAALVVIAFIVVLAQLT